MDRGSKAASVKRIRIHDLRHSHVSLLINQGYQAAVIADRLVTKQWKSPTDIPIYIRQNKMKWQTHLMNYGRRESNMSLKNKDEHNR